MFFYFFFPSVLHTNKKSDQKSVFPETTMNTVFCRTGLGGDVVFFQGDQKVASVGFGSHLKNWAWKQPRLYTSPTPVEEGVSCSILEGVASNILIKTKVAQKDNSLTIDVEATPEGDEPEICSVRLNVSLPVAFWSNGSIQLNSTLKLPKQQDPINKNSSLFGDIPQISSVQQVDGFTFISASGLILVN